jgi:hypothetical protein
LGLGVRLLWELGAPLALFLGLPLLLHLRLPVLPLILLYEVSDFGGWLLLMLVVIFITGSLRAIIAYRTLHGSLAPVV